MGSAVAEVHESEQFLGAPFGFFVAFSGDERGNHNVFKCRKFGQQLMELEHETDVLVAEIAEFFSR